MNGVWNQSPPDTVTSAPKCSTILETCHVDDDSGNGIGCHCGWPNHTKNMTGCDSLPGSVKWYHLLCVGIDRKKAPEGKWLCLPCVKSRTVKISILTLRGRVSQTLRV